MIETTRRVCSRKLQEIPMRDPYLFADEKEEVYYLYGTTAVCNGAADIDPFFEVYRSRDLINFEGPFAAFQPPAGFWGVRDYWAPEVHAYRGAYYMFASFKGAIGEHRGTAVLRAEHPGGPFVPHSAGAVTLAGEECLDGTLYVDGTGRPWIVFCHEWTSIYYGKIKALPLAEDLTKALSEEAVTLVDTETDRLPWIRRMYDPRVEKRGFLTDAPFLHRNPDGSLLLLWSSYAVPYWNGAGAGGYVVARCVSPSGSIRGPWRHEREMLLDEDAGHCAVFRDFEGKPRLVCHCNDTKHGSERPVIYSLRQKPDGLEIEYETE